MRCYICKSGKVYDYRKVNNIGVVKCSDCKLIFVPEISDRVIEEFYSTGYFSGSGSETGYADYLKDENNHRENARNLLKKTLGKYRKYPGLRVLDIGCAHGFFLDEARKLGHEVYGLELSEEGYHYATDNLGLKIAKGTLSTVEYNHSFFDAIFLIGTIEHMKDPGHELSLIRDILKDGGLLIITTIDTGGILPLYHIKPPEHLFYFSHGNIRQLLRIAGFTRVRTHTYFVRYRVSDLFARFNAFFGYKVFGYLSSWMESLFPNLSMQIPTNEMLVIAEKEKG